MATNVQPTNLSPEALTAASTAQASSMPPSTNEGTMMWGSLGNIIQALQQMVSDTSTLIQNYAKTATQAINTQGSATLNAFDATQKGGWFEAAGIALGSLASGIGAVLDVGGAVGGGTAGKTSDKARMEGLENERGQLENLQKQLRNPADHNVELGTTLDDKGITSDMISERATELNNGQVTTQVEAPAGYVATKGKSFEQDLDDATLNSLHGGVTDKNGSTVNMGNLDFDKLNSNISDQLKTNSTNINSTQQSITSSRNKWELGIAAGNKTTTAVSQAGQAYTKVEETHQRAEGQVASFEQQNTNSIAAKTADASNSAGQLAMQMEQQISSMADSQ